MRPPTATRQSGARQQAAAGAAAQEQIAVAMSLAEELKQHQLHFPAQPRPLSLADFGAADLSPVPLALLSRGGTVVSADRGLFKLLEAPGDQVLLRPLAELLPRHQAPALFKLLARCQSSHLTRRAEFSMALPGRAPKAVLLIVSPPPAGESQALFRAAFVDLSDTEPRDFGPRLPQEDARIIEAIDGIVWEAVSPMCFTFVSRQAERLLGFPASDWLRDSDFWEKHVHHEDRERVVRARAEVARQPRPHVLEYRMVTADRRMIWVKDSAVVLAGAPGWVKMCGIITDVTDLETAREQLNLANQSLEEAVAQRTAKMEQSLEAMETLCYGIAHDMKAPLRGLQGFIDILVTDYQKAFDATGKSYAARCQAALRRMGELIEAVLAYGRLNHTLPELIPVQVKPILTRALQSLETDIKNKHPRIDLQMRFPKVIGNPYLLEQVFTNLISNAIKFAAPGVPPEISISATQTESTDPSIHQSTPFVRLTFNDNGIGISPEFVKRMFGMFQKGHPPTEYPGSGIGLAIVKRAVELMNGRLGVLSDPGHGSSFWIELPLASNSD